MGPRAVVGLVVDNVENVGGNSYSPKARKAAHARNRDRVQGALRQVLTSSDAKILGELPPTDHVLGIKWRVTVVRNLCVVSAIRNGSEVHGCAPIPYSVVQKAKDCGPSLKSLGGIIIGIQDGIRQELGSRIGIQ